MVNGNKAKAWGGTRSNFDRNLAIIIGIDDYKSASIQNLGTAVSDAQAIAQLLEDYGYQSSCLYNEQTTLEGLRNLSHPKLSEELHHSKGDRLIIYFAGHGLARSQADSEGPEDYLVPHNADPTDACSSLSMREFYDALSQLNCYFLVQFCQGCILDQLFSEAHIL